MASCDCPMCGTLGQIFNKHQPGQWKIHRQSELYMPSGEKIRAHMGLVTALLDAPDLGVERGETILLGVDVEHVQGSSSLMRLHRVGSMREYPVDTTIDDMIVVFDALVVAAAIVLSGRR